MSVTSNDYYGQDLEREKEKGFTSELVQSRVFYRLVCEILYICVIYISQLPTVVELHSGEEFFVSRKCFCEKVPNKRLVKEFRSSFILMVFHFHNRALLTNIPYRMIPQSYT